MFYSIIIVALNDKINLIKTFKSLELQDFKEYELIFIDGKSVDGTYEVFKEFRDKNLNAPIKLISEKDTGIYDAMNKGAKLANGEWLFFLNAGDVFFRNTTLENIHKKITQNEHQIDIYYGNVFREDLNRVLFPPKKISYYSLNKSLGICHQTIFCKKQSMLLFDTKYKLVADLNWLFNQMNLKRKFSYINETVINYDVNGKSSNKRKLRAEMLHLLKKHSKLNYFVRNLLWKFFK